MQALEIRDARSSDQQTILDITLAAFQEYAEPMVGNWEMYKQNILTTLADVSPAEQIVTEINGTILGTVLLYPARGQGTAPDGEPLMSQYPEFRLLAVAPVGRGHGIGRALVEECIRRARSSGATALDLHTIDLMQAAVRLYERMGFVRAPENDWHPVPEFTIKGFRLRLGPPTA